MKLVKIHTILSFKQSNWVKNVDFNTKKKQESLDEFNKSLHKLLNNCIYDKSIEHQRKRMNVKLISDQKTYLRCVNKLLNNCIYDKSIEHQRKRMNVKLISDQKTYLRCANKPNFILSKIFDKSSSKNI